MKPHSSTTMRRMLAPTVGLPVLLTCAVLVLALPGLASSTTSTPPPTWPVAGDVPFHTPTWPAAGDVPFHTLTWPVVGDVPFHTLTWPVVGDAPVAVPLRWPALGDQ